MILIKMFKEKFKYFKKKNVEPNFQEVLNIESGDPKFLSKVMLKNNNSLNHDVKLFGLKEISLWNVYELKTHPGFIYIINPFTNLGQRYWIARSIADYSNKPNITNLDNLNIKASLQNSNWWEIINCEQSDNKPSIKRKLRWATMGYHHDWNTKVYSESKKSMFPNDLCHLCQFIIKIVLDAVFKAEAAIVNFYQMDSFLSGHVDRSEPNLNAPLISFSFGQSAIFLIGGHTLEENPDALLVRSGDIILMTGISRLQYHAIPKIIQTKDEHWNDICSDDTTSPIEDVNLDANLNMINECTHDCDADNGVHSSNILENETSYNTVDRVKFKNLKHPEYWKPFDKYIKTSRININVRQVLFPEQKELFRT